MTSNSFDEDFKEILRENLRTKVVALTRTYLGVPWRHQGRTYGSIDCVGLPIVVGRELGLHDYDDSYNYRRKSTGADLMRIFDVHCARVKNLADLKGGDIVIFKDQLFAQHVGIMSSIDKVIHATVEKKRVVEERLEGDLRSKLLRGYRFKALDDGN